jgi:hypothetical protein
MFKKINRTECLTKYKSFPLRWYNNVKDEEEFYSPKTFNSFVLTLPSKSFRGHAKHLGLELTKFVQELGFDSLVFLGDNEIPWLNQHNEYKPVAEAQLYLAEKKIGRRFNGALEVTTPELPVFVKHMAWLIRCNASLPYFHFIDAGENIMGAICQYGNIHLYTLKADTVVEITSIIGRSKFEYLTGNCSNEFGRDGAIRGRQAL